MPSTADVLLTWPRERERQPFDVQVWNRFMNFMNGNLYGRAIWLGNDTVFLLSLDNAGTGGNHLNAGGILTVTDATGVLVSSVALRLANNVWLLAANQAGSGTVNLVRLNTSDVIEVGAAANRISIFSPLSNNTPLNGRNAANSASLVLLNLNASNVMELGGAGNKIRILAALQNNQPVYFRNAADAADIAGFLMNASDILEIGEAGRRLQFNASMANATKLSGRNAANAANVVLIGLNASDVIELGVAGTRMTVSSPLTNATKLNGRNAANSADINLIGVNASDQIDVGVAGTQLNLLGTLNFVAGAIPVTAVAAQPSARAFHNASQLIATATTTALALNSERYDTDTIHDTAVNNSRLTCKTAGKYAISGSASFAANATGYRKVGIRLAGATMLAWNGSTSFGAADTTDLSVSTQYDLAVNDYVEMVAHQTSGGNLNVVNAGNYSPELMMHRTG
jgi:hypothetical protein